MPYTAYTDAEYQEVTMLPTYTGTYTGKSFNNTYFPFGGEP
jgi:hypothetical protein